MLAELASDLINHELDQELAQRQINDASPPHLRLAAKL
jgi:hypothetical protein